MVSEVVGGRVGAVLGLASVQRLDVSDGTIDLQPGAVLRLRAAVERVSPDIVMLPWYLDAAPTGESISTDSLTRRA
jgi:hypothetical protein